MLLFLYLSPCHATLFMRHFRQILSCRRCSIDSLPLSLCFSLLRVVRARSLMPKYSAATDAAALFHCYSLIDVTTPSACRIAYFFRHTLITLPLIFRAMLERCCHCRQSCRGEARVFSLPCFI